MAYKRTLAIRQFILDSVRENPSAIMGKVSEEYQISTSAARRHIKSLVTEGLLAVEGTTRARKYSLVTLVRRTLREDLGPKLQEDVVYQNAFADILKDLPQNVADICHYGFTEIVNNAIDHSKGDTVLIRATLTAADIEFLVMDDGVGVFNTIKPSLNLEDRRHAVLELVKGKLTTDPRRHSGEGLFFTSRCFDQFTVSCSGVTLVAGAGCEWSLEPIQMAPQDGTYVSMLISRTSTRTFNSVIEPFTSAKDPNFGFSRTEIPVNSARIDGCALTSRSQATRLLSRLDQFQEVVLDFRGVPVIGQGFADEIFRVFALAHPGIKISHKNANEETARMIKRALAMATSTNSGTVLIDAQHIQAREAVA